MEASSATQETDRATPVEVDLLRTRAPSAQPTPRIGFRTQAERERVLGWLSAGLREGRTDRLMGELPLIFSAETTAHHLWLQDDEAPICFATLWPVCFRIGEASLRAGLVSNVFTDPSRQHEGLASALLRRALGLAEAEALGLVLLWSELEELYAPLGFDRAGDESLILVDRFVLQRAAEALAPPTGQTVVPATAGDWEEIERLRHLRTCELRLPVGLISAYRDVPDLDVRVARDGTGVQGFAIRGRGDDLKEVIHEWGGAPSSALACCRALLEAHPAGEELFVLGPPGRDALCWALRRAGAHVIRQPLAWMRIVEGDAFARDLARILGAPEALEVERLGDDDGAARVFRLRSSNGECMLPQRVLLEALLGHPDRSPSSAVRRDLRRVLGPGATARLPVPFHVAGLESI